MEGEDGIIATPALRIPLEFIRPLGGIFFFTLGEFGPTAPLQEEQKAAGC